MSRGATRAAVLAVALALVAPACTKGDAPPPKQVVETRFLDRLSGAIKAVNDARGRLATDGNVLGAAAQALDDVDEVAVNGDRAAARKRRPAAAKAVQAAAPIARRLNDHVRAYERAVAALDAAEAPGLTREQLAALGDAVQAGRGEVTELKRYAAAVASAWPRYEKLDADQKLWVARASNGWYRTQNESAGAYVVLTERQRLATARRTFATADARRVGTARTTAATYDRVRAVLASLLP
ncbi:MAG TPA: hypothetical protein VGX28_03205 [Frankiaceae bacterium]|jgi:hypothetical protein|nr:hypothetical protein [Frankiaceae bacterium]